MFSYNPSAEAGNKVTEVMLEGSSVPLDRNDDTTPLVLVANNFIMNGGSGYSMLASIEQLGEIGGELETVEAYAIAQADASNNTLSGDNIKGRINIDGEYVKKDYTAKILILNDDETPAVGAEVSYYVDGTYTGTGVTDADGYLNITVADGPHGVSLAADQQQIYINNYTGAGTQENEYRGLPSLSYREPTVVPSTDPTSGTKPTEETQPSTSADVPVSTDDETSPNRHLQLQIPLLRTPPQITAEARYKQAISNTWLFTEHLQYWRLRQFMLRLRENPSNSKQQK